MQEERLIIKYTSARNCFVYLPEIFARRLNSKETGLKLLHNNNNYYVSWYPISVLDESLRINATFARILDIKEGEEVFVSSLSNLPFLSSITVTPGNVDDWVIVESQAETIQSILLNQVSLIAKNQSIVVWIGKGLSITFSIDAISPDFELGKIGKGTEVHVEWPKCEKTLTKNEKFTIDKLKYDVRNFIKIPYITPMIERHENNVDLNDIPSFTRRNKKSMIPEVFRVYNLSAMKKLYSIDSIDSRLNCPYNVFIDRLDWPRCNSASTEANGSLYKIRKVCQELRYVETNNTDFLRTDRPAIPKQSTELIVRLFVMEMTSKEISSSTTEQTFKVSDSIHNKIYASANLRRNLRLSIGSKVTLEPATITEQSVTSIEIFPSSKSLTKRMFRQFLLNTSYNGDIVLNSRTRLYIEDGTSCMMLCSPENLSYQLIDKAKLEKIDIAINNATLPIETPDGTDDFSVIGEESESDNLAEISLLPFESIITECRITLELSLGLTGARNFRHEPENVLICGDVGVGKTTLCRILQDRMEKFPHYVHVHVIECKSLKGKRAEAIHKIMCGAMADCTYYQPSILFLDDLESITNSPSGEEENTPDTINASRIMDVIFNICGEYQSSHYISVVATCTNINKVGAKLRSPRGVHLFRTVLTIPDLARDHRIDILKLALRKHVHVPAAMNFDYYGNKTEGWVAQDLIDFAEKAAFAAWKRHVENKADKQFSLTDEDLSETLEYYKTISLHDVRLYKSTGNDWSNIGGLAKVKEVLTQLLKWPMQYPELYRNAPIKNQNGVLLYGMPGTGKTILASAIAKECGVNFISVKGPELLSKYIGASEEAVRNVFEKARRAKPCVLFFDEFDSLAPRRGHDSTGVTDRVVNQLLTQLDGVEGREGVAVVAATSRPDLLDPALIRPGRLDKSLLCALPDQGDREEILDALCRAQGVDTRDLDIKHLAQRSLGFTGADLNAVLTQAKYDALECAMSSVPPGSGDACLDTIKITQQHLIDALNSTKPSLSSAEKEKYRRIYDQFSGGNTVESVAFAKQKATLA